MGTQERGLSTRSKQQHQQTDREANRHTDRQKDNTNMQSSADIETCKQTCLPFMCHLSNEARLLTEMKVCPCWQKMRARLFQNLYQVVLAMGAAVCSRVAVCHSSRNGRMPQNTNLLKCRWSSQPCRRSPTASSALRPRPHCTQAKYPQWFSPQLSGDGPTPTHVA